jgi:hypothetical protein
MRPLNRTMLTLVIITLMSNSLFANDGTALPNSKLFSSAFIGIVKKFDAEYNVSKVCACQILKLRSNNEQLENVALFSEKINNGDLSSDFTVASEILEKEKKQMKFHFYKKVTVVTKLVVPTDCKTLYRQLKVQNDDLRMYELLDADVKSRFSNLNR